MTGDTLYRTGPESLPVTVLIARENHERERLFNGQSIYRIMTRYFKKLESNEGTIPAFQTTGHEM